MPRKVLTTVSCIGIAIQGVFFTDYEIEGMEGREHVFSGVQRDARTFIDRNVYGIDSSSSCQKVEPSKSNK